MTSHDLSPALAFAMPPPRRRLAAALPRAAFLLALAPGAARAVFLNFFGDSACANGSTPGVGPFFSTLCSSATGQGAALISCSAAAPAAARVAVFSDVFCTGTPLEVINVSETGCTPVTNAAFGQGGFARLAAPPAGTQCEPSSPFYRIAVTLPNPLSPGDAPRCQGPTQSVTINGGNCAPNGLFGFNVFTKVTTAALPALPRAVCAFQDQAACLGAPACLPGPVAGPGEQFHLGFAGLGQCLPYAVPIPVPLPPPFPQTVQAGLVLEANPPFPPVVSPTPSASSTPSATRSVPASSTSPSASPTPLSASPSPTQAGIANAGAGSGAGAGAASGSNALAAVVGVAVAVGLGMFCWVHRKKLLGLSSPLKSGPVGEPHFAANPLAATAGGGGGGGGAALGGVPAAPSLAGEEAQRDYAAFLAQRHSQQRQMQAMQAMQPGMQGQLWQQQQQQQGQPEMFAQTQVQLAEHHAGEAEAAAPRGPGARAPSFRAVNHFSPTGVHDSQ